MLEDRVDPDFSFAGHARSMSPGELTDLIEQCTWGMDADSALVKALHRGIGVHHSGLPTKYRQVVEILFRCHYLRVVIATGDSSCCHGKACLAPDQTSLSRFANRSSTCTGSLLLAGRVHGWLVSRAAKVQQAVHMTSCVIHVENCDKVIAGIMPGSAASLALQQQHCDYIMTSLCHSTPD